MYFAPYTTGEISIEVLQALRNSDLKQLRTLIVQQEQQDADMAKNKGLFQQRNSFGENVVHLVCRMGVAQTIACLMGIPNLDTILYLLSHAASVPQVLGGPVTYSNRIFHALAR